MTALFERKKKKRTHPTSPVRVPGFFNVLFPNRIKPMITLNNGLTQKKIQFDKTLT